MGMLWRFNSSSIMRNVVWGHAMSFLGVVACCLGARIFRVIPNFLSALLAASSLRSPSPFL
eukprot:2640801-Pyramimonas_sp.AAC.1